MTQLWNLPTPGDRVAQACVVLLGMTIVLLVVKILHDWTVGDD
jgi:hypothetical protein